MTVAKPWVAVQTYTIRKDLRKDITATFERLASLGIPAVELARIPFTEENAQITATISRSTGIWVLCLQVPFKKLQLNFSDILNFCQTTDCPRVSVSVLPLNCIIGGLKPLQKFASDLEVLGQKYKDHGIELVFHHHDFEFAPLKSSRFGSTRLNSTQPYTRIPNQTKNRKTSDSVIPKPAPKNPAITKLDFLLSSTTIGFIMDTYWAKKSGYNPKELAEKFGPRLKGVHLRDLKKRKGNRSTDCELGHGIIDFDPILRVLGPTCTYTAIEQKSLNPWKALQTSIAFLKQKGRQDFFQWRE